MLLKCVALACVLAMAQSRDREPSRINKITPAITSSLVNLGKMDISINFNYGKGLDASVKRPELMPQGSPSIGGFEPCPCSSMKNFVKNPSALGGPDDFINKILSSNDLFAYDKEPVLSGMCCDTGSHEHVQEETIFIDVSKPKGPFGQSMSKSMQPPLVPLALDLLFGGHPPLSGSGRIELPKVPTQKNPIEIFFFPNKKVNGNGRDPKQPKKGQPLKKAKSFPIYKDLDITVVGDKELRNDFKTMNFVPPLPSSASVKKDLHVQEKKETPVAVEKTNAPTFTTTIASPAVSVESKDILVENKDIPVENRDILVENKDIPLENRDIYTEIPLVNSNLLKES